MKLSENGFRLLRKSGKSIFLILIFTWTKESKIIKWLDNIISFAWKSNKLHWISRLMVLLIIFQKRRTRYIFSNFHSRVFWRAFTRWFWRLVGNWIETRICSTQGYFFPWCCWFERSGNLFQSNELDMSKVRSRFLQSFNSIFPFFVPWILNCNLTREQRSQLVDSFLKLEKSLLNRICIIAISLHLKESKSPSFLLNGSKVNHNAISNTYLSITLL